jgi:asparagine synthase (glutamine-hydrolysing)
MAARLPDEILKFKKVGLSVPWGDYLIKSPEFIDEIESFAKSDLFKMEYFESIDAQKLVANFKKGDTKLIPYLMPLFMMHIWQKTYATQF